MKPWITGIFVSICVAGSVLADDGGPVKLEVASKAISLKPGATAVVRIQVHIEPPYHIYTPTVQIGSDGSGPNATQVTLKTKEAISMDDLVKTSPPIKHFDPNFGMDVFTLEGSAWLEITVKAGANLKPGKYPVAVVVNYQACNDENCLMPQDVETSFEVDVPAG